MSRRELRSQLVETFGPACEWPDCGLPGEEMAHIEPRGMGGRPSVDRLDNVAWLCRHHHDVLDGRRPWTSRLGGEIVVNLGSARARRNYLKRHIAPLREIVEVAE